MGEPGVVAVSCCIYIYKRHSDKTIGRVLIQRCVVVVQQALPHLYRPPSVQHHFWLAQHVQPHRVDVDLLPGLGVGVVDPVDESGDVAILLWLYDQRHVGVLPQQQLHQAVVLDVAEGLPSGDYLAHVFADYSALGDGLLADDVVAHALHRLDQVGPDRLLLVGLKSSKVLYINSVHSHVDLLDVLRLGAFVHGLLRVLHLLRAQRIQQNFLVFLDLLLGQPDGRPQQYGLCPGDRHRVLLYVLFGLSYSGIFEKLLLLVGIEVDERSLRAFGGLSG